MPKTAKKKLTATTPHGTFKRSTHRPYTFVSVFGIPDKAIYESEIGRVTRKFGADKVEGQCGDFVAHCHKMIQVAEQNANNPLYVSEVKWHATRKLAESAKATWTFAVKVGVFPVDGTEALPASVLSRLADDEAEILRHRVADNGTIPARGPLDNPSPALRVSRACSEFPGEFGLRNFPGDVFRVNLHNSYVSGDVVMIYLDRRGDFNGTKSWTEFCKGTASELRAQIRSLSPEVTL